MAASAFRLLFDTRQAKQAKARQFSNAASKVALAQTQQKAGKGVRIENAVKWVPGITATLLRESIVLVGYSFE